MPLRSGDMFRALTGAIAGGAVVGVAALWGSAPAAAAITAVAFLGLRGGLFATGARRRHARDEGAEQSPLARLVQRYARRVHELDRESDVASATEELLDVGLGYTHITFLVPAPDDDSWHLATGARLDEGAAPDPLLLPWILSEDRPVERGDVDAVASADLRESLTSLLSAHGADVAIPLLSRDEVVGLITAAGRSAGKLTGEERTFLRRVMEEAAAALVYVRMKRSAVERVALAKDVELTAAVQEGFIPRPEVIEIGSVSLAGAYLPASRCGGDWWSVHALARGRVLVLIGDATGHGIDAAMVTAAAKGCVDVATERFVGDPDLGELLDTLDGAIRRVGAGRFHITMFVTLIDVRAGQVRFANAGHNVPYVCRPREARRPDLKVLPARGNPLGSGDGPVYEQGVRAIEPGDVLVWYTDGIVEGYDDDLRPFGDRRMQRTLRELVAEGHDVEAIRDGLINSSLRFQGRRRPLDDMTAVVATITDPVR